MTSGAVGATRVDAAGIRVVVSDGVPAQDCQHLHAGALEPPHAPLRLQATASTPSASGSTSPPGPERALLQRRPVSSGNCNSLAKECFA
jgi:hypothetical protein